ncbi:hypothetical protein PENSPDRAFT_361019 [Peniophora sp. CONT]|nr:hypothetical protein PENSPDRAFT_361019 [Peniophora sp. CONT]
MTVIWQDAFVGFRVVFNLSPTSISLHRCFALFCAVNTLVASVADTFVNSKLIWLLSSARNESSVDAIEPAQVPLRRHICRLMRNERARMSRRRAAPPKGEGRSTRSSVQPLPTPPARELHPRFVNLLIVNPYYFLAYLPHFHAIQRLRHRSRSSFRSRTRTCVNGRSRDGSSASGRDGC